MIGLAAVRPEPGHPNLRHIAVDLSDARRWRRALAGIGPLDATSAWRAFRRVGTVGALDPANGLLVPACHGGRADRNTPCPWAG